MKSFVMICVFMLFCFSVVSLRAESGYLTIEGTRVFSEIDHSAGVATFSNSCGSQTLAQSQLQAGAIPNNIIPCPRPGQQSRPPARQVDSARVCSDGRRCNEGYACIGGNKCIPVTSDQYCGQGKYCTDGFVCIPGGKCIPATSDRYCGNRSACDAGFACISGNKCLSVTSQRYCGGRRSCGEGFACINGDKCLPTNSERYCGGGKSCGEGFACVSGGKCLPTTSKRYCGNRRSCEAGYTCVDGSKCVADADPNKGTLGASDCECISVIPVVPGEKYTVTNRCQAMFVAVLFGGDTLHISPSTSAFSSWARLGEIAQGGSASAYPPKGWSIVSINGIALRRGSAAHACYYNGGTGTRRISRRGQAFRPDRSGFAA